MAMGPFFLILLSLDVKTGDLVKSDVVGKPYASLDDCVTAAIGRGPQRSDEKVAGVLVCEPESDTGIKSRFVRDFIPESRESVPDASTPVKLQFQCDPTQQV